MRETSASKLWKEMEDKFMKKGTENKLYTRTKLYRFQYKPGTTMNDHITRFDSLVTDLLNLDEKVSDVDKALILLASLPDEYEHLIVSMLTGKETITFKEVTTALYSNEIRKKRNYKLKTTNQFPKKLRQKVNTQNNWVILQIDLSGGERCALRIDGDPPFIGGEEGGNPTSNRCGIPYFKKATND